MFSHRSLRQAHSICAAVCCSVGHGTLRWGRSERVGLFNIGQFLQLCAPIPDWEGGRENFAPYCRTLHIVRVRWNTSGHWTSSVRTLLYSRHPWRRSHRIKDRLLIDVSQQLILRHSLLRPDSTTSTSFLNTNRVGYRLLIQITTGQNATQTIRAVAKFLSPFQELWISERQNHRNGTAITSQSKSYLRSR